MWNKRNSFMKNINKLKKKERNISKRNTTSPWIRFNYENRLGIQIWIFLHQVLDYHDVSMKAYLDLTLYMILHYSCLVWTALYSLYMPMYVQKPCSRCLYAADQPQSLFTCPPYFLMFRAYCDDAGDEVRCCHVGLTEHYYLSF